MDNTHAMPEEIAYLAGLIDGEGCIAIQKQQLKNNKVGYGVNVKITNTDSNMIEAIQDIYLKLGVNPLIRERGNPDQDNWKAWFEVYLTKQAHIKIVLEAILPYLRTKKARAQMMLRYINKEIDREVGFQFMKQSNSKGKPSETTRETPDFSQNLTKYFLDEDIVHPATNVGG
jgi:intein/homing endonuclease